MTSVRFPDYRCSWCGLYGCDYRREGRGVDFYYCGECLPIVAAEYDWHLEGVNLVE